MNESKSPSPSRLPHVHQSFMGRRIVVLCTALLLLSLAFAAPVLAMAFPPLIEQGTVPPPPPGTGGEDDDDDDNNNNDDDPPVATPTPAPASEAGAAQVPEGAESVPTSYPGVVLSPRLNLRSGPGTAYPAIGQLLQNDSVSVQFRDSTGDWWYTCCISGTTTSGWASASFIRTDFSQAEGMTMLPLFPDIENLPTPAPVPTIAATSTRVVNSALTAVVDAQPRLIVRDAPGTNGVILGRVADGATVEVIARNAAGDWWYICCIDGSETEGWANAAFLVPNFNAASASSLIPLFGATSTVQLPTPTPTPASRSLPVITKMPKVLDVTPTPVVIVTPTAAPTATPTTPATPTPAPTATAVPATPTVAAPEETATPESIATPEPEATGTALPEEEGTPQSSSPTTLEAVMWQEPAFAAPGDTVLIRYLITNRGADLARVVEVRNELPAELQLGQGAGSNNARFVQEQTSAGATVFSLLWDAVPAGESVSGTVAVQIAPDMAPGRVIFNIASIGALNAAAQSASISISTPPSTLPDFQ